MARGIAEERCGNAKHPNAIRTALDRSIPTNRST